MSIPNGADLTLSRRTPVISFTSLDYESLLEDLLATAVAEAAERGEVLDVSPGSLPKLMAIFTAYLGDVLGYNVNGVARELFASTLQRRLNLINLGKPFGWQPAPPSAALVVLRLVLDPTATYPLTITEDDQFATESDVPIFYQPTGETQVLSYPVSGYVDVEASEGELYSDALVGISNGQAAQKLSLTLRNVLVDSISVTVANVAWTRVSSFVRSSDTDTHYRVVYDDLGNVSLYFGDGVNGALPANGTQIRASYRVGGGRRGRVLKNTVTAITGANEAILSVNNPDDSTEGENAQPMRTARYGLGDVLSTMDRAVEKDDYGKLARLAAPQSIAKARSKHVGGQQVNIYIAPNGGGQPSDTLKNTVLASFEGKKGLGHRPRAFGPTYRELGFEGVLYVNSAFKTKDVETTTLQGLLNVKGSGLLDFAQLDFGAVQLTENGDFSLLLSSTRLQTYFGSLKTSGLDRAEITRLDVQPIGVAGLNNTGNGTFAVSVAAGAKKKRTYRITMTTPTTYTVAESVVSIVARLTDHRLYDPSLDLTALGVTTSWRVQPDIETTVSLPITAIGNGFVEVPSTSGTLFALTAPKRSYALLGPSLALGTAGVPLVIGDTTLTFTAGTNPNVNGDTFEVDVYPQVGDLILRPEEYPKMSLSNLVFRSVGGARSLAMRSTFISVCGQAAGTPYVAGDPYDPPEATFEDTLGSVGVTNRKWEVISFYDGANYIQNTDTDIDPDVNGAESVFFNTMSYTVRFQTSQMLLVKCTRTMANGTSTYDVGCFMVPDGAGTVVPAPGLQPWMLGPLSVGGWAGGINFAESDSRYLLNYSLDVLKHNNQGVVIRAGDPLVCLHTDLSPKLIGSCTLPPDIRYERTNIRTYQFDILCRLEGGRFTLSGVDESGNLLDIVDGTSFQQGATPLTFQHGPKLNVDHTNKIIFIYASITDKLPPSQLTVYNATMRLVKTEVS